MDEFYFYLLLIVIATLLAVANRPSVKFISDSSSYVSNEKPTLMSEEDEDDIFKGIDLEKTTSTRMSKHEKVK